MFAQNRLTSSKSLLLSEVPSRRSLNHRSTDTIMESILISSIQKCLSLESFTPLRTIHRSNTTDRLNTLYRNSPNEDSSLDEQPTSSRSQQRTRGHSWSVSKNIAAKDHRRNVVSSAENIAQMMSVTEYDDEKKKKIYKYKDKLNNLSGAWRKLHKEDDASVLAGIIWDWFDELQVS